MSEGVFTVKLSLKMEKIGTIWIFNVFEGTKGKIPK